MWAAGQSKMFLLECSGVPRSSSTSPSISSSTSRCSATPWSGSTAGKAYPRLTHRYASQPPVCRRQMAHSTHISLSPKFFSESIHSGPRSVTSMTSTGEKPTLCWGKARLVWCLPSINSAASFLSKSQSGNKHAFIRLEPCFPPRSEPNVYPHNGAQGQRRRPPSNSSPDERAAA